MALIHWEPFQTLDSLRQQMDDLFEYLHRSYSQSSHLLQHGLSGQPAVEIQETDTEIILKVEMPGIDVEDMDIQVSQNAVSIVGQHQHQEVAKQQGFFQSEFHYGQFQRTIPLPKPVQKEQVKAELNKGILLLNLPKMDSDSTVVQVNLVEKAAPANFTANQPMEQAPSAKLDQVPLSSQKSHEAVGLSGAQTLAQIQTEQADQQLSPKTSLETYCDEHPEAGACRIYDD